VLPTLYYWVHRPREQRRGGAAMEVEAV